MTADAAEAFCERLRITVSASGADLAAPGHWVPGRLGPLDWRFVSHLQGRPSNGCSSQSMPYSPPDWTGLNREARLNSNHRSRTVSSAAHGGRVLPRQSRG